MTRIGAQASAPRRDEIDGFRPRPRGLAVCTGSGRCLIHSTTERCPDDGLVLTTPRCSMVVVATTVMLAACGAQRLTPGAGRRPRRPPRVALIMKSLANEFFVTMAEGARAHQAANARGYTLLVNGIRNESDLAQQVALVEQMMAQGVDAIVIAPADSRHWSRCSARPSIRDSWSSTSTTSSMRPRFSRPPSRYPFVGPDNRAGAKAVGCQPGDASAAWRQGRDPRRHSDRVQCPAAPTRVRGCHARCRHGSGCRPERALGTG